MTVYIDDFLVGPRTFPPSLGPARLSDPDAVRHSTSVLCLILSLAGFFVSLPKSNPDPLPIVRYLRVLIDFVSRTFSIPPDKRASFLALLRRILSLPRIPLQLLESLAGKCAHFAIAIPGALAFTREFYSAIAAARASDSTHIDP
ncbi:hypothetical protein HDU67_010177, partial [Dinochytrium kinnereticum]